MHTLVWNTIWVLIVLGVIVFIHELGHFLAAKSFGVRVETFSLGFGTRLIGFRRGDTDYRISALPFGGYVKMTGETAGEDVPASDDPMAFSAKPRWQRFIIAAAGPVMNILLAIWLLVPVYMHRFERPTYVDKPVVVAGVEPNSPAAKAGLQRSDQIISFDGVTNPTWEQLGVRSAVSVDHPVALAVLRNGKVVETTLTPSASGPGSGDDDNTLGIIAKAPVLVDEVSQGSPAAKAGIQRGDHIVAAAGSTVLSRDDLLQQLQTSKTNPITLTLDRGDPVHQVTVTVTPALGNPDGRGTRPVIGVGLGTDSRTVKLNFSEALRESLRKNKSYSLLIFDLLGKLLSHRASLNSVSGPVAIASVAGQAARQPTFMPLLFVTSMISLNLGIMNLLPIPVLDGGMILFLFIETLLRRDVSRRIKERIYQVGFAFLILLMTFVVYNDIVRSVSHSAR